MVSRWAVLTSDEVRHRYFANVLTISDQVVAVVSEPKKLQPSRQFHSSEEERVLNDYFRRRVLSEEEILAEGREWKLLGRKKLIHVGAGEINSVDVVRELVNLGVEGCLVFGTSWLRAPWISSFERLINLHLGLSPYFRGSGTNFWALERGMPEYVGATVHRIDEGIDSGPIFFHVRPDPAMQDDPHRFFNKVIQKAVSALKKQLPNLAHWEAVPQPKVTNSHEYKMRDFDVGALHRMLKRVEQGMLSNYAKNGKEAAQRVNLIREFEPVFQMMPS